MDEECIVSILVEHNQRWVNGLQLVISETLAAVARREQVPVHHVCEDIVTIALRMMVELGHHPIRSIFEFQSVRNLDEAFSIVC